MVKQSIDDFGGVEGLERAFAKSKKEAPFRFWLEKLNRNDRLPRGKFFKGSSQKTENKAR